MGKRHLMITGAHDFERKGCQDCKHGEENLTCWCTSKEAVEYRGTHLCGMVDCPFWEPCLHINDFKRERWYKKIFHAPIDDYKLINGKKEEI